MKSIFIFFFIIFLGIVSCDSNDKSIENNDYQNIEILQADKTDIDEPGIEQVDDTVEQTVMNDSLKAVFNKLNTEYKNLKIDFDASETQYYKFRREYSATYEDITEIWYFDTLFSLAYYTEELTAEGGYQSFIFQKHANSELIFHYHNEGEMDDLQLILSFETSSLKCEAVEYNPNLNSAIQYTVPIYDDLNKSHQKHLIGKQSEDFLINKTYTYSYYEKSDSEYGNEEVGFNIEIDSLLFNHLDF